MSNATTHPDDSRYLSAYFIHAYAISWSIGVPLALANQSITPAILPQWTHYLIAYGPMISALIVTWLSHGLPGLKELGSRIIRWSCPKWWIVAFSPLIIGFVVILILNGLTGTQISLSDLGEVNYLAPLRSRTAWLLWIFTFGLGEEIGWRGFALPLLQKDRSALAATTVLAAFWALWHLPQFFYLFDPSMAVD